ncbi:MAG: Wzz/FepE/Etk N-terminal domain-containing protein [Candidatus Omnitrophota bacterium]
MESEFSNMTLRDYLRVLFRQKAVVLTAILTVTITVFIGLKFKTPVYEGQVKVLVSAEKQVESPYYRDLISSRNTEVTITQGEIVKSSPVIEQTVKALALYKRPFDYEVKYCSPWKRPLVEFMAGRQTKSLERFPAEMRDSYLFRMAVEDLKSKIKVEPIRDTNTFTISVRDFDPVGAATITNTLSRAFLIYDLPAATRRDPVEVRRQASDRDAAYGQHRGAGRDSARPTRVHRQRFRDRELESGRTGEHAHSTCGDQQDPVLSPGFCHEHFPRGDARLCL